MTAAAHASDAREPVAPELAEAAARIMQALASAVRLRILDRLRRSPCSVGELAAAVGMEQTAVSNHLRVLRHLDLVVGRRAGRRVVYSLHDDHVETLLEQALTHVAHLDGAPLERVPEAAAGPAGAR